MLDAQLSQMKPHINPEHMTSLRPLQRQRFANLAKFKASVYRILVATDVAAR